MFAESVKFTNGEPGYQQRIMVGRLNKGMWTNITHI